MKFVFTFSEVNEGRIEIEADSQPEKREVIDRIMEGGAEYNKTGYLDIRLVGIGREKPASERARER